MLTRFTRLGCGTGKPGFSFAMRAWTPENLMAKKGLHFSLWLYFSTQADLLGKPLIFRGRSSCREGWQEPRQILAVPWGQVLLQADWTLPTSPGRPTRKPPSWPFACSTTTLQSLFFSVTRRGNFSLFLHPSDHIHLLVQVLHWVPNAAGVQTP